MKLIVFFNGWGMDEDVVKHVKIPRGYKVEIVNYPYEVDGNIFYGYKDIIMIGWSFGCYYLAKYLLENDMWFENVISINGVPETIGDYGISSKIFDNTLENLTPETLEKFYLNMGTGIKFIPPKKDFCKVKEELQYFSDNYKPLRNVFTKAYIGKRDIIIPASKQTRYYKDAGVPVSIISCGHYPFLRIKDWFDIIGDVENEL